MDDKKLIVIITRAYAQRNAKNDEWIEDWGLDNDKNSFIFEDETYPIIIIHGCKEMTTSQYIQYINEIKKSSYQVDNKIFFEHGLDSEIETKIKEKFGINDENWIKYSSTEGNSVYSVLERKFEEKGIPSEIVKKIIQESKKNKYWLRKYDEIQLMLIELNFIMCNSNEDSTNKIVSTLNRIKDIIEEQSNNTIISLIKNEEQSNNKIISLIKNEDDIQVADIKEIIIRDLKPFTDFIDIMKLKCSKGIQYV